MAYCKVVSVTTKVDHFSKAWNVLTLECGRETKRKKYKFRNTEAVVPKRIKCDCKGASNGE